MLGLALRCLAGLWFALRVRPDQNDGVRIDLRDSRRRFLFRVALDATQRPRMVDPPAGCGLAVGLDWDQAMDDAGVLQRCPVCGCRELFVRRDFPHAVGLAIVVVAGLAAAVLFATGRVWLALSMLAGVVVVDTVFMVFVKRCLVCYRCRSEFRDTPIGSGHESWDLAIGEKYRQVDPPAVEDPPSVMNGLPGSSTRTGSLG